MFRGWLQVTLGQGTHITWTRNSCNLCLSTKMTKLLYGHKHYKEPNSKIPRNRLTQTTRKSMNNPSTEQVVLYTVWVNLYMTNNDSEGSVYRKKLPLSTWLSTERSPTSWKAPWSVLILLRALWWRSVCSIVVSLPIHEQALGRW